MNHLLFLYFSVALLFVPMSGSAQSTNQAATAITTVDPGSIMGYQLLAESALSAD